MQQAANPLLRYWEIGAKWSENEKSPFGESLGFWNKKEAEEYLQARMDADPVKAAEAKAFKR